MKKLSAFLSTLLVSSTALAEMAYKYVDPSGAEVVVGKALGDEERLARRLELKEVSFRPDVPASPPVKTSPTVQASPGIPREGDKTYDSRGNVIGVIWKVGGEPMRESSPAPSSDNALARDAGKSMIELERARLESAREARSPSADWNNYNRREIDKRLDQLERDPQQYFYDKEQRDKRVIVSPVVIHD